MFQSAVAHELISSLALSATTRRRIGRRFKALSRMSSFPARAWPIPAGTQPTGFKALSRMSSFPAHAALTEARATTPEFQSAVAHELISSAGAVRAARHGFRGFKALSRMSSFPAGFLDRVRRHRLGFQSAVAHELISSPTRSPPVSARSWAFQSAVAHELISSKQAVRDLSGFVDVSKRCRA